MLTSTAYSRYSCRFRVVDRWVTDYQSLGQGMDGPTTKAEHVYVYVSSYTQLPTSLNYHSPHRFIDSSTTERNYEYKQTIVDTMSPIQSLDKSQKDKLQQTLDELAGTLPGCFLTLVTPTETLFDGWSGKFDKLDPQSREVNGDDVMWFASTTKLITAVCESLSFHGSVSVSGSPATNCDLLEEELIGYRLSNISGQGGPQPRY